MTPTTHTTRAQRAKVDRQTDRRNEEEEEEEEAASFSKGIVVCIRY